MGRCPCSNSGAVTQFCKTFPRNCGSFNIRGSCEEKSITMDVTIFALLITAICLLEIAPLPGLCGEPTWKNKIVVSQHDGIDNKTCWNGTIPCKTLDFALQHLPNSTLIQLRSGEYNLSQHFNLTNVHGFGLTGDEGPTNIKCESNGSLSFENSEDIIIRRILLDGCGGLHASTTGSEFKYPHIPFLSAVFFVYCKNIAIDNCSIINSPGIGVNMYDVGGDVRISNSWFQNNRPNKNYTKKNIAVAGGGVYMELTYQGGTFPFDLNSTTLAKFDSNSSYIFYNCTFIKNSAPNQGYETIVKKPFKDDHIPFSRGGGLSIFLRGKAENNIIQIDQCHFDDNYAVWGGGAFIEFHDQVQNNTLEVTSCTFKNNNAHFAGGGFRSGETAEGLRGSWLLANNMKYENCSFENNSAILGGGIAYYEYSSPLKTYDNDLFIKFKNCVWKNNTATMGSAIAVATDPSINGLWDTTAEGSKHHIIVLEDCDVTNNQVILTKDKKVIGQGAIYSYSLPVIFKGVDNIESNNNTAMVIENAAVHVFGNVTFRNNTGDQGGALGLYGTSVIMLMPQSQLNFFNNIASERGGAIYVKDPGPPVVAFNSTELKTQGCFIAYNNSFNLAKVTEWQTKIVFKGNKVRTKGGGDSVYASTLQGCRQDGEPRINSKALEWSNTTDYQDSDKSIKEQIATDPVLIKFNELDWEVSPSEVFDASIQLIDEKSSSVLGVVKITIIDELDQNAAGSVRLGTVSRLFLVQGDPSAKIKSLYLEGKVERPFTVLISTAMGRVVHSTSKRTLTLRHCSVGFKQTDSKSCSCEVQLGISNCSVDSKHVFLKRGYWGGPIRGQFSTYPCPQHHCNTSRDPIFEYNPETLCNNGRNGSSILCGACKDNYSVNLGNEECSKKCTNKNLWLALAFCIVTTLLVLVVFCIRLDIFTTYLNTWLYSYQIILFLLQEGQNLDHFISFIIGVANWTIKVKGVGICLYSGMTNLEKLGVNYVLPAYILLLLFVLAKVGRCRPGCFINRNVASAFCTLLVLCYTNVTMISFNIVHYVPIHGRWVLYADGNIDFARDWRKHLPFTIMACLWIVLFVMLVPLLLLFTPWFLRHIPYLNNFRLFFDTFKRCFKVQCRWFAAYYFICRIVILCIALYVPFGPLKRMFLEVSSVIIMAICLYLQPYNDQYQWFNRLDAVLLTNLCLVVNFSSVISEASQPVQDSLGKTVNALAYVPLIYLLVLICYNGWRYFCPRNFDGYAEVEADPPSMSETGVPNRPV